MIRYDDALRSGSARTSRLSRAPMRSMGAVMRP